MTIAQQSSTNPAIPAILQQAVAAFEAELPDLLRTHEGQWVGYHGSQSVGFSSDKTRLCRELMEKYPEQEILVRKIEPETGDVDMTW